MSEARIAGAKFNLISSEMLIPPILCVNYSPPTRLRLFEGGASAQKTHPWEVTYALSGPVPGPSLLAELLILARQAF